MRLWGRATSINVQKVLWALAELGLDHERVDAGGRYGVVDTPAYARLNPNRLVPTLEDGDLVLWESNAIVRYLFARYGGDLAAADLAERARQDQWTEWAATTLAPALSPVFWGLVRTRPSRQDPNEIAARAIVLGRCYVLLDRVLATQPFLAGERFSMADIPAGATLWRYCTLPIERPALPFVEAWYERLQARAAYRATVMTSYEELRATG